MTTMLEAMLGEAFDIMKNARELYLSGWKEYPHPRNGRMVYGSTVKVGPVSFDVRISQEDDTGKKWAVDYHDGMTWASMFDGKVFLSDVAAAQTVRTFFGKAEKLYDEKAKTMSAKNAAFKAFHDAQSEV
jgi:hypothetical protein